MKNKQGKTSPILIVGIIVVAALFAYSGGYLDSIFAAKSVDPLDIYPASGKTSVTLNTGDALATSATNANVSYYVFTSDGKYLKEGTTSAGTASFDVPTAGNYKLILYSDSGTSDFLPIVEEFTTNGGDPTGRAIKTINVDLFAESNATIEAVRDPVDLDSIVSVGAGQTINFDVLISTTTSKAVVNKPIVRMVVNSTNIEDVDFPALKLVDCPDRLTTAAAQKDYCFLYDKQLSSSDGILTFQGNLLMDSANGAASDNATITILDTGLYRESKYRTEGFSAFKYGSENPVDNSDVASGDSSSSALALTG